MLNELADLHRSLVASGIDLVSWHPWIKPLRRARALILSLSEDGSLGRVATIPAEEAVARRSIVQSNHASFPAFNLKCPLSAETVGKEIDLDGVQRLICEGGASAYHVGDLVRIERLFQGFAVQTIGTIVCGQPGLDSTEALIGRLAKPSNGQEEVRAFVVEVANQLLLGARRGDIEAEFATAVLFGQWNKGQQLRDKWDCTVFLEVADTERFPRSVSDPATARAWSNALIAWQQGAVPGNKITCALSGRPDDLIGEKMPNPNLRLLGLTYLMSMNRDISCQERYGLTGTDVYRVGMRTVQGLNDAILYITDESRKSRTWGSVPNGTRTKGDLLIAYVEEEPDCGAGLVGLFSDEDLGTEERAATFEARTASVLAALDVRGSAARDKHVRMFALSEIDKGRKQVVFSGRYAGDALVEGRNRWVEGARNLPLIQLPFSAGRGKKAEWRSSSCPSPSDAMHCFKRQWRRDGVSAGEVPGIDLGLIYDLYLSPNPTRVARWLAGRFIPQVEPLLLAAGASKTFSARLKDPVKAEALKAAALIGILLLLQGRRKEQYMESREFLLGRFLQLADQLHKAYCEEVRKGDIPPQLIGNAAMTMAMERPARALEMLAGRMAVYLAWSDRFKGEKAGLVRWFRKELGDVALKLREQDLSQRVSTNGRAEVLLGYLASTRKSEGEEQQQ